MAHDNFAVVTRFVTEFLGRGNVVVADATTHERIEGITGLKPTGPIDEREEYKATIQAFVDAFPAEAPLKIIDQFASADGARVVTRSRLWPRGLSHAESRSAEDSRLLVGETFALTRSRGSRWSGDSSTTVPHPVAAGESQSRLKL